MRTKSWSVYLIFFCTFIISFAQLFLKIGSKTALLDLELVTNYSLMAGLFLYAIGAILLVVALKGGELSVLYPLIASSFIWVSFLSIIFLNEEMSMLKWTGIVFIIAGIGLIGKGAKIEKNG